MLKRWKSISCLATGGSSSNKVSQWVDQPLYPLTGNPLRVFGPARCTEKKVELVMKVRADQQWIRVRLHTRARARWIGGVFFCGTLDVDFVLRDIVR